MQHARTWWHHVFRGFAREGDTTMSWCWWRYLGLENEFEKMSLPISANSRSVTCGLVHVRAYLHFWDGLAAEKREVFYGALHYFLNTSVLHKAPEHVFNHVTLQAANAILHVCIREERTSLKLNKEGHRSIFLLLLLLFGPNPHPHRTLLKTRTSL